MFKNITKNNYSEINLRLWSKVGSQQSPVRKDSNIQCKYRAI